MSIQFNEEQEVYLRFNRAFTKRLKANQASDKQKAGRKHLVVIRDFELLRYPELRNSNDHWALFLALINLYPEADYQISSFLDDTLSKAKKYGYQGSWKTWKDFASHFNLTIENKEKVTEDFSNVPTLNFHRENLEGTVFSPFYVFEFLTNFVYSEDDIFGNILPRSLRLIKFIRTETWSQRDKRISRRPVVHPIRKGGYNDKGSLQPFDSRARELANKQFERPEEPRFTSLDHVVTWGDKE